jgi:hypothetical protein
MTSRRFIRFCVVLVSLVASHLILAVPSHACDSGGDTPAKSKAKGQ